jgi:glycerophosphoryl diester phosphodiesterase
MPESRRPLIIAHRGASGDRPEHSLAAHALAIEQGCDVIEPDLVFSADGELLVRHDLGLARSTDIADRAAFANRVVAVDGGRDWLAADLSWAELQQLRCRQPWPQRSNARDGLYPLIRFADLLDLAASESRRRGRRIVVYPETKHPAWHRERGHDFVAALTAICRDRQIKGTDAPVWLQSFEWDVLDALKANTGLRCFALIDQATAFRPDELHGRFDGVGIAKQRIDPRTDDGRGLLAALSQSNLAIHAWTFRHDLPGVGWLDAEAELRAYLELPLEALFCDFPGRARALGIPSVGGNRRNCEVLHQVRAPLGTPTLLALYALSHNEGTIRTLTCVDPGVRS